MALLNQTTVSIRSKTTPEGPFTELLACFDLPDFGADPENVDTTTLKDKVMTGEQGIGDPGELEFQFRYRPGEDQANAVLDGLREAKDLEIQVEYAVGLTITFPISSFSTKFTGGGVNEVMNFTLAVSLAGDFKIKTPTV